MTQVPGPVPLAPRPGGRLPLRHRRVRGSRRGPACPEEKETLALLPLTAIRNGMGSLTPPQID